MNNNVIDIDATDSGVSSENPGYYDDDDNYDDYSSHDHHSHYHDEDDTIHLDQVSEKLMVELDDGSLKLFINYVDDRHTI